MNIKNNLLLFAKSRWFERVLCLLIILVLSGFFYSKLSKQQNELKNYSVEIANHEENAKNLLERIDLLDKEIIGLNNKIYDYEEEAKEQSEEITSLNKKNADSMSRIRELNKKIYELKEERGYWISNEDEMIIDARIDPDILTMLIKHAKALNERDYETYKSTWFSGHKLIDSSEGWFYSALDWSSDYHYERELVIKKICLLDYQVDEDEPTIFVDMVGKDIEDGEGIVYGSYQVAVVRDNGQWYVANYH